jgi:hypothetical protein
VNKIVPQFVRGARYLFRGPEEVRFALAESLMRTPTIDTRALHARALEIESSLTDPNRRRYEHPYNP